MVKKTLVFVFALAIPLLLIFDVYQAGKYAALEKEIKETESRQYELVESNKRLLSGISVLSSPDRIEKLAVETLKMRKALPEEIIRIELKGKNAGS